MNNLLTALREDLIANVDEKTKNTSQHFFKEEIKTYGVKMPLVNKLASNWFKAIRSKSKEEIFLLCRALWESGYIEESFIACHWSYALQKQYEPTDFLVFDQWVRTYVNNWASCDTLCNHSVGTLVERHPELIQHLKEWATDPNRWVRRAAAVTLIIPARKGLFKQEILEIATLLLTDSDDLVQKGYGWMLKAASESDQSLVFDFVMHHKAVMPRTALRYAIEKLPQELKAEAMKK